MTCRTSTPGAISTTGGSSLHVALVKISTSTPALASRSATSTMYTFMPPASPVPGWSSGDVCTDSVATLRGRERRDCGVCLCSESTRATSVLLHLLPDGYIFPTVHVPSRTAVYPPLRSSLRFGGHTGGWSACLLL